MKQKNKSLQQIITRFGEQPTVIEEEVKITLHRPENDQTVIQSALHFDDRDLLIQKLSANRISHEISDLDHSANFGQKSIPTTQNIEVRLKSRYHGPDIKREMR